MKGAARQFFILALCYAVAGMVLGCHAQHQGQSLRIEHLFAGLRTHAGNLALVGVFYLLGGLLAGLGQLVWAAAALPAVSMRAIS